MGWKRASEYSRKRSKFHCNSLDLATKGVLHELKLMGVSNNFVNTNVVISTNVPLRRDGLPYSGMANPKDSGAAVYFIYKNKNMVFACDTFINVIDNLVAIQKTIEAIRGIQRWGASDMMERSFTGFEALPEPKSKNWWDILGVARHSDLSFIKDVYRKKATEFHPDRGGNHEQMTEINHAWEAAQKEKQ